MGFSTPHSERDAVIQLGMVAGPYLSHPDGVNERNNLAERISVYIQTVREYGQSNDRGHFSSSYVKKLFGIQDNDSPAVRYNKICNTQRKKRFFEAITHLVKNHAMCKSFAHSVFLFMAASSIQV